MYLGQDTFSPKTLPFPVAYQPVTGGTLSPGLAHLISVWWGLHPAGDVPVHLAPRGLSFPAIFTNASLLKENLQDYLSKLLFYYNNNKASPVFTEGAPGHAERPCAVLLVVAAEVTFQWLQWGLHTRTRVPLDGPRGGRAGGGHRAAFGQSCHQVSQAVAPGLSGPHCCPPTRWAPPSLSADPPLVPSSPGPGERRLRNRRWD